MPLACSCHSHSCHCACRQDAGLRRRLLASACAAKAALSASETVTAEVPSDDGDSWQQVPVSRQDFEGACEALITRAWATVEELGRQTRVTWARCGPCCICFHSHACRLVLLSQQFAPIHPVVKSKAAPQLETVCAAGDQGSGYIRMSRERTRRSAARGAMPQSRGGWTEWCWWEARHACHGWHMAWQPSQVICLACMTSCCWRGQGA